ncbi:hypothetical protein M501DRAFT_1055417 [Patellaria atrata CBS 101060]|uniref:Transcription factor IIIC subunit 5 HTH domain-containing protein n=1 Tax=Patellaria atrata CBS 101060 TaxID=1346257 RepID=A0A9P4SFC3_9PEZI|nr:hypothetical protein M501DRAFT_1055417 [Patellaria atrata CBS 101060]
MSVSTEEEMIAGLVAPNEAQNGTAPAAAPNGMQDGIHPVENKEPPSWLSIPNEPFVSVEHPCIVHNIDNCIKSLGGERRLDRFLKLKDNKKSMGASLRLNDPMAQPVLSSFVKTQNLLIKVTVPKRTGRKRKRGCSDPFKFHEEVDGEKSESSEGKSEQIASRLKKKPQDLLRSMRDNPDSYKIQPVGTMEETHKFRSLPDYQYSITHNRTAQDFQEFFTKPQWSKLKNFQFDKSRYPASGAKADVGPCPQILSTSVPFNYAYRQNMYIKFHSTPHGQPLPINTSFSQKYIMHKVSPTCAPSSIPHRIPSYPPLPPESTLPDYLQNLIQDLRAALDARPIMTRRVIHNLLGRDVEYELKQAYAYVGYVFSAGPWREALVKFGVDPRSDPKYLAYQTIWFKLASKEQGAGAGVIEEEGGTGEGRRGEWMDSRIVFHPLLSASCVP